MKQNISSAAWRFAIFAIICSLFGFAMVAVFGQLRFGKQPMYKAEFTSVSGLKKGDLVRVAGVEVGKVKGISIAPSGASALVEFDADDTVPLTRGSRAVVRYANLTGDRYLALEEGPGDPRVLRPGETIGVGQTAPALDLDALIGGFKPLLRSLNPEQTNALTSKLIQVFQGEGSTVGSLLDEIGLLTNSLGDRDELIGQLIGNLNAVLGSFSGQHKQLDTAVTSLSKLVADLAARKTDVTNAVAYTNAAAGSVADLLNQARPPLAKMITEVERVSGLVTADRDYVNNFLETLPDAYRVLARQGLNGDYFNFYMCQIVLKTNGKGGQPVYTRVANQVTGRCAPK